MSQQEPRGRKFMTAPTTQPFVVPPSDQPEVKPDPHPMSEQGEQVLAPKAPRGGTPKKVDVDGLTHVSLLCRDIRHAWQHQTDYTLVKIKGSPALIKRVLVCERCKTERYDEYLVPSFEHVRTSYSYAEGYQAKGVGHVPVQDIRKEYFKRMTDAEAAAKKRDKTP